MKTGLPIFCVSIVSAVNSENVIGAIEMPVFAKLNLANCQKWKTKTSMKIVRRDRVAKFAEALRFLRFFS